MTGAGLGPLHVAGVGVYSRSVHGASWLYMSAISIARPWACCALRTRRRAAAAPAITPAAALLRPR